MKNNSIKFKDFQNIVNDKSSFLLIGHEQPDGDAIGSILALNQFLRKRDKTVDMVVTDKIPNIFSFLPDVGKIKNDFLIGDYEVIILLDNGDLRRTGFHQRILKARDKGEIIINIDHHPQNDIWKIATINLAKTDASSTCEIIYDFLVSISYPISSDLATFLLLGIYGDTGGFLHSNTSNKVMLIVSELLKRGAKLKKISTSISQSRSVKMLKLWGLAINNLFEFNQSGLMVSVISKKDIEKIGADEDEVSGLINLINTVSESKASLLIYETFDGKIRGSLRTDSDDFDVSCLAKALGGGGHHKASGFSLKGKLIKDNFGWRIV